MTPSQDDISPTTFSVVDNSTGRRINAAPYYSEHWSTVRTYTASMSYVTGSHAAKFGMNMKIGGRYKILNQVVEFEEGQGPKGPQATRVRAI